MRADVVCCRLDGLRIMMEFPKPKDDEEQAAENITERKQVWCMLHSRLCLCLHWQCRHQRSLTVMHNITLLESCCALIGDVHMSP